MANLSDMMGLSPEQSDIATKLRMAEMLRSQSMQPSQGQMVSGHYVAPSALQGIAKLLGTYKAGKLEKEAGEASKAYGEQQRADFGDTAQKYFQALQGTPEKAEAYQADNPFGENLGNLQSVTPAKPGSQNDALLVALQSKSPQWQQIAMQNISNLSKVNNVNPVKVERWNPETKQTEIGWATPGRNDFTPIGVGKPEKVDNGFSQDMGDYLKAHGIDPNSASTDQLSAAYSAVQDLKTNRARLAGQTVTLGTPQIFTTSEGQTAFVQPANRPGAKPQVTYLDKNLKQKSDEKPTTEAENTAAGYLGRMESANALIEKNPQGISTVGTKLAEAAPVIGQYAGRLAMTPEQQRYKQAADDWIRSKLRKESGAVIGKDEAEAEYVTYFPQPGDGPEVIAQKARARKQAEEQMRLSAGRAAEKVRLVPSAAPQRAAAPSAAQKPAVQPVGAYSDAEKERRYQEWKARMGK